MFFCLKVFVKYLFSENTGQGKKRQAKENGERDKEQEWNENLFVVFIKKHFSRLKKRTKSN